MEFVFGMIQCFNGNISLSNPLFHHNCGLIYDLSVAFYCEVHDSKYPLPKLIHKLYYFNLQTMIIRGIVCGSTVPEMILC